MSRPVVNKDLSFQQIVESALVAVAQQQPSTVTRIYQRVADSNSSTWLASMKRGRGLLVCLHRALSSLQVEAHRKHLTCVSWSSMQETDDDARRQALLCTCRFFSRLLVCHVNHIILNLFEVQHHEYC